MSELTTEQVVDQLYRVDAWGKDELTKLPEAEQLEVLRRAARDLSYKVAVLKSKNRRFKELAQNFMDAFDALYCELEVGQ